MEGPILNFFPPALRLLLIWFLFRIGNAWKGVEIKMVCRPMLTRAVSEAVPAVADDVRREAVYLSAGSSGFTIHAKLKDDHGVGCSVDVSAGRKMRRQRDSGKARLYFNVLVPDDSAARRGETANHTLRSASNDLSDEGIHAMHMTPPRAQFQPDFEIDFQDLAP